MDLCRTKTGTTRPVLSVGSYARTQAALRMPRTHASAALRTTDAWHLLSASWGKKALPKLSLVHSPGLRLDSKRRLVRNGCLKRAYSPSKFRERVRALVVKALESVPPRSGAKRCKAAGAPRAGPRGPAAGRRPARKPRGLRRRSAAARTGGRGMI